MLGVGPGDANVYNLSTWPEAVVFLGIIAAIVAFLYMIVYPFVQEAVEYRKRCRKCPEEDKKPE